MLAQLPNIPTHASLKLRLGAHPQHINLIESKWPVTHNQVQNFRLSKIQAFGDMPNMHCKIWQLSATKNSKQFGQMMSFGNPSQRIH
jgi:hypothetical protein